MTLFILALYHSLTSPNEARRTRLLCIASVGILILLSAFVLAFDGNTMSEGLQSSHKGSTFTSPVWGQVCIMLALGAMQIVGDSILVHKSIFLPLQRRSQNNVQQVWRCYIIWYDKRYIALIPALALFLSLGERNDLIEGSYL